MQRLARRPVAASMLVPFTLGALSAGCGSAYRYHALSPPFERSVADWPGRGDPPRRILRIETVAGTSYTVRLTNVRADSLVGLVGFEDYTVANPDTLRLAWSDVARAEVRERTGNEFRNLGLVVGVVAGTAALALVTALAIAFSGL